MTTSNRPKQEKFEALIGKLAQRLESSLHDVLDELNDEAESTPHEKDANPAAHKLKAKAKKLGSDLFSVAKQSVILIKENPKEVAAIIAGAVLVAEVGDIEDGLQELAETGEYDPVRANTINL